MKENDKITLYKEKIRIYHTALYARLSVEDNENSIENQIMFLRDYVKDKPYLNICSIYMDNGWSGTHFQRPEFNKMMEEVKWGKIDCIVVKDLSRLGRNYLEIGSYIETIFPILNVRFIAVTDQFDTLTADITKEGLLIPFKNLINDIYAKDISKKVSCVLEMKIRKGEYGGGLVPFGYRKNKNKLEIDPQTAIVVKRIFQMRAEGNSYHTIIRSLNDEKILSPSAYRYKKGIVHNEKYKEVLWKRHVVTNMLSNRVYLGYIVKEKTELDLCREEEQEFQITHEPIIEKELFFKVQKITEQRKKEYLSNIGKYSFLGKEENIFGKKVICGDCGAVLTLYKNVLREKDIYYNYICPNYTENQYRVCNKKNIRKGELEQITFKLIQFYILLFINKTKLVEKLRYTIKNSLKQKKLQYKFRELKQKIVKMESINRKLYLDYKEELLTKNVYFYTKEKYKKELNLLKEQFYFLEQIIERYFAYLKEDIEINQLIESENKTNKETANYFIKRILVYKDNKIKVKLLYKDEIEIVVLREERKANE